MAVDIKRNINFCFDNCMPEMFVEVNMGLQNLWSFKLYNFGFMASKKSLLIYIFVQLPDLYTNKRGQL